MEFLRKLDLFIVSHFNPLENLRKYNFINVFHGERTLKCEIKSMLLGLNLNLGRHQRRASDQKWAVLLIAADIEELLLILILGLDLSGAFISIHHGHVQVTNNEVILVVLN